MKTQSKKSTKGSQFLKIKKENLKLNLGEIIFFRLLIKDVCEEWSDHLDKKGNEVDEYEENYKEFLNSTLDKLNGIIEFSSKKPKV